MPISEEQYEELARLCSLDIGQEVKPLEVKQYLSIAWLRLGDPMMAFARFTPEDQSDLQATIIKEIAKWAPLEQPQVPNS